MPAVVRALALYFAVMTPTFTILSLPLEPATFAAVKEAPPWAVASVASVAAAIAAVADYYLIRGTFRLKALARIKEKWLFQRVESWVAKAPFITTVLFAALPVPFILVRVLVPLSGYSLPKYATAVAIGRYPRILAIAMFGQIVVLPNWVLAAIFGGAVVLVGIALYREHRKHQREVAATKATSSSSSPPP